MNIFTSVPLDGEDDGKKILRNSLEIMLNEFMKNHNDVFKHFITKKKNDEAKFCKEAIDKVMRKAEFTFTKAEIPSGKSDGLSSE